MGWRGGHGDCSGIIVPYAHDLARCTVTLSEYDVAMASGVFSREGEAVLCGGVRSNPGVLLTAPPEVMYLLAGDIASEANHAKSERRQALLDSMSDKIEAALSAD